MQRFEHLLEHLDHDDLDKTIILYSRGNHSQPYHQTLFLHTSASP